MQLAAFLQDRHVPFESLPHAPAYTATMRAKYLGVPGRQVAKSLLLHGPAGFLLAVLPATHHVDVGLLAAALGGPVRLATDAEITGVFRDCEWGVVPPFGTLYGLTAVLDDEIAPEDFIVFEGQTHVEAVRLRCSD